MSKLIFLHISLLTYIHSRIHTHTHARTHAHAHALARTRTHTHKHAHIHICVRWLQSFADFKKSPQMHL